MEKLIKLIDSKINQHLAEVTRASDAEELLKMAMKDKNPSKEKMAQSLAGVLNSRHEVTYHKGAVDALSDLKKIIVEAVDEQTKTTN